MKLELLRWEKIPTPVSDKTIREAEEQLEVKFPPNVVALLKNYHGATLPDYEFDYEEPELGIATTGIGEILNFRSDNYWNLLERNKALSSIFPKGIVAIARDMGSNYICLDYRDLKGNEPSIVYCSLDTGLEDPYIFVASNLTSFLDLLRLDE